MFLAFPPSGACSPKQVFLALTLTQGLCIFTLRYALRVVERIRMYFQDTCRKVGIVSITKCMIVNKSSMPRSRVRRVRQQKVWWKAGVWRASYKRSYY